MDDMYNMVNPSACCPMFVLRRRRRLGRGYLQEKYWFWIKHSIRLLRSRCSSSSSCDIMHKFIIDPPYYWRCLLTNRQPLTFSSRWNRTGDADEWRICWEIQMALIGNWWRQFKDCPTAWLSASSTTLLISADWHLNVVPSSNNGMFAFLWRIPAITIIIVIFPDSRYLQFYFYSFSPRIQTYYHCNKKVIAVCVAMSVVVVVAFNLSTDMK